MTNTEVVSVNIPYGLATMAPPRTSRLHDRRNDEAALDKYEEAGI